MIEEYPWILDYGISPDTRLPVIPGDTSDWVEGALIPSTPVPNQDEVHGQTTGRPGVSGHRKVKADKFRKGGNFGSGNNDYNVV